MTDKVHDNKLQILGKLAASLSHEIKNPLSVLKLNLDYLKMSKEKYDDETNECIDASLEAADIINKLIHNTLEFSRKNKSDFDNHQINDIIEKSVQITHGSAHKKNILIKLELSSNLPLLFINETKILQVFVNIISNSIEASSAGSTIFINSYLKNDYVNVEIIDEGLGIDETVKEKIFDDFYTSKESGTGLGLSVCKTLLDEHNANYKLTNNSTKGTTFFIQFKV